MKFKEPGDMDTRYRPPPGGNGKIINDSFSTEKVKAPTPADRDALTRAFRVDQHRTLDLITKLAKEVDRLSKRVDDLENGTGSRHYIADIMSNGEPNY